MATSMSEEPLKPLLAALSRDIRLYEHAADDVDDVFLAQLFSRCAEDRRDARRKLRPYVSSEAELAAIEADTPGASLERVWTDLKALILDDRKVLLETLGQHEETLSRLMDKAASDMPEGAARQTLSEAQMIIERSHRDIADQLHRSI